MFGMNVFSGFNSIMVRLRDYYTGFKGKFTTLFQFHYGAIKRAWAAAAAWATVCFNSIMVRLRVVPVIVVSPNITVSIPLWCD